MVNIKISCYWVIFLLPNCSSESQEDNMRFFVWLGFFGGFNVQSQHILLFCFWISCLILASMPQLHIAVLDITGLSSQKDWSSGVLLFICSIIHYRLQIQMELHGLSAPPKENASEGARRAEENRISHSSSAPCMIRGGRQQSKAVSDIVERYQYYNLSWLKLCFILHQFTFKCQNKDKHITCFTIWQPTSQCSSKLF